MIYFILIISLFLDFFFSYYLPFFPTIFSYFQPELFYSTILFLLILNAGNKKKEIFIYLICLFYDFLFQPIYGLTVLIFLILTYWISFFQKRYSLHFFSYLFLFSSCIILIPVIKSFFLFMMGEKITFSFLLSQIINTFLFNVCYGLLLYFIFGIKKKKVT